MSNYGFTAYEKSSEKEFSRYNNQYILRPVERNIVLVQDISYMVNLAEVEKYPSKHKFRLPEHLIRLFKNNGWQFHFLPIPNEEQALYIPIIDLKPLFKKLKDWKGGDIDFYVFYVPKNTTIYFQQIARMRNDRKHCGSLVLIGFQ